MSQHWVFIYLIISLHYNWDVHNDTYKSWYIILCWLGYYGEFFKSLLDRRLGGVWNWCFKTKRPITQHINMVDGCACSSLVSVGFLFFCVSESSTHFALFHQGRYCAGSSMLQTPSPLALWSWINANALRSHPSVTADVSAQSHLNFQAPSHPLLIIRPFFSLFPALVLSLKACRRSGTLVVFWSAAGA